MAIFNSSNGSGGSAVASDSIPIGLIAIWSGTADNIPSGWNLCDGTNGTIDLRDKFVLGSGDTHTVGSTGGEENHVLIQKEMPIHAHAMSVFTPGGSSTGTLWENSGKTETYGETWTTGGNQAHNNMPPYYTLCYIQKITGSSSGGGSTGGDSSIPAGGTADQLLTKLSDTDGDIGWTNLSDQALTQDQILTIMGVNTNG